MTTWNPSDKAPPVTLSGGDLTATLSAAVSDSAVRGTTSGSANRFFSVTVGVNGYVPGGSGMIIGVANASQSLSVWIGYDSTNGIGYAPSGVVYGAGGSPPYGAITSTGIGYDAGDVITFELLASTAKVYKNGSFVYTFASLPSGSLLPAVSLGNLNDAVTANFGASDFDFAPSGSSAWDGSSRATVAQTLPALGQTAAATVTGRSIAAAQLLPSLGQTATATASSSDAVAAAAQTLPGLGQTATATGGSPEISVAQTLPGVAQAATVLSGSGSAVNTKWNETDKSPAITLSSGGLVATNTSSTDSAVSGMVRSTIGSLAGNSDDWYLEITPNAISGAGSDVTSFGLGLSTASQSLDTGFDGSNGFGYYANGWFIGPGFSAMLGPTYGVGDIIGIRKTSSGVAFTKNGTLVRTQTSLPAGVLFPSSILFTSGDQVTADFGATAFASLPSGAMPWFLDPSTLPARNITVNQTLPLLLQIATLSKIDPEPVAPVVGTGGFFPNTIAAVLQGRTVRCDFLVRFDFLSGTMRMWQGFGTLRTNDGFDWQGIGQLGQISDLESAIGGNAPQAKFTLSGVDQQLVAEALDQTNDVYGQDCNIYLQFFDADFNCLDNPYVVWAGIMDQMRVRQSGPGECQVDLTAETIFARRALPPLGTLTDREQQRFFPGDNGLTFIPSLMSKTAIWPVILPQS